MFERIKNWIVKNPYYEKYFGDAGGELTPKYVTGVCLLLFVAIFFVFAGISALFSWGTDIIFVVIIGFAIVQIWKFFKKKD